MNNLSNVGSERVIVVGKKSISSYLIDVAVMFQEASTVVLRGEGKFISKAVDLFNAIMFKMGESVELVDVSIGSNIVRGRIKPYIVIKVKRK
ncbi:MAG: DNA-binding protein [Desulfurococcaceae archaeon]